MRKARERELHQFCVLRRPAVDVDRVCLRVNIHCLLLIVE
jgi:hypothetical protein